MQAAEHGADFPMAKKLRGSMSHSQLHDFAVGSEAHKPEHVGMKDPPAPTPANMGAPAGMPEAVSVAPKVPMLKGASPSIMNANTNSLKNSGMNELDATKASMKGAGKSGHPHKNLGNFLHPRKGQDKI